MGEWTTTWTAWTMRLVLVVGVWVMMANATGLNTEGPNVCQSYSMENVRGLVNRTFSCWQWQSLHHTDPACQRALYHWQRGHRRFYQMYRCNRRIHRVCSREVYRCYQRRVTNYFCCEGYEMDEQGNCVAVSECQYNNGGCQHTCHHLVQNQQSHCSCRHGYELGADLRSCEDIDECASGTSGCNQGCLNEEGGFTCTCNHGYQLTSPYNCTEVNECELGNGGCEQLCTNTDGAFYCSCEEGFQLERGAECSDVDECLLHNGGCSDECFNLYGSHRCGCTGDRVMSADQRTCMDPAQNSTEGALPGRSPESAASTRGGWLGPLGHPSPLLIGLIIGCALLALLVLLSVCVALRMRKKARRAAAPPAGAAVAAAGGAAVGRGNVYDSFDPPPPYTIGEKKVGLCDMKEVEEIQQKDNTLGGYANKAFVDSIITPSGEKHDADMENVTNETSTKYNV